MESQEQHQPSEADVKAALDRYADRLMAYPNVNAVGIQEQALTDGKTEPVIQVYVTKKLPAAQLEPSAVIPKQLDLTVKDEASERARQLRVKVRVQEIGELSLG